MILVERSRTESVEALRSMLQRAIELEFSTLPPYLYALYSTGSNQAASRRILDIVHDEMAHMMLACNVLNAIGGDPLLADPAVVPTYPGRLPFSIGSALEVRLLPFSEAAMLQAMAIEEPEDPIRFEAVAEPTFQTIGEFYDSLREPLQALPVDQWDTQPERQVDDAAAFPGALFPVRDAEDALRAIDRIVSQGEGTPTTPLDFLGELAHYYRFSEIERDRVLERDPDAPNGFRWGDPLGIDWTAAVDAIADPAGHDFAADPVALAAQEACDRAYTVMLLELQRTVLGEIGRLGNAVLAMFRMRQAALAAFAQPLAGSTRSAGPAFRYRPELTA